MDQEVLVRALKRLHITAANWQMVEYWLSLWEGGEVPRRESFDPSAASELLRGCGLFEVVPGRSVHCRIAGTILKLVFGPDVAGQDWLAITAPRNRHQRLVRYSAVAQGAVGLGRRQALRKPGAMVQIEEVMLPFRDLSENGTRFVLVHSDWRPEGQEWFGVDPTNALTLADDFHIIPLDEI